MLVTISISEKACFTRWPTQRPKARQFTATIQEELFDLLQRHYMESDDATTRLWLQSFQSPHLSGYATLPKETVKPSSHKYQVQTWRRTQLREEKRLQKAWYETDIAHLKGLQAQVHCLDESPRLYEGGSSLSSLRRPVCQARVFRQLVPTTVYAEHNATAEHTALFFFHQVFGWPELKAPRRVMLLSRIPARRKTRSAFELPLPPVDFASGRMGRGLDRDGIWSTRRWQGDQEPRGRASRRSRRRAASEPPAQMFTAAFLPHSDHNSKHLLVFPKMSLATIEKRTRRRSLSRTRIAEMFNWDTVLPEPQADRCFEPDYDHATGWTAASAASWNLHQFERLPRCSACDVEYRSTADARSCCLRVFEDSALCFSRMLGSEIQKYRPVSKLWTLWDWLPVAQFKMCCSAILPVLEHEARSNCANCGSGLHNLGSCSQPCGHCGNVTRESFIAFRQRFGKNKNLNSILQEGSAFHFHYAPWCPVLKHNRCKCGPFPQYHVAAKCAIVCSRDCGNVFRLGHFKHKNAMGCKSRCCMCGIRGHSGSQCKLRRCRCGGDHLGQDCRFHPECRTKGCDRYLCGYHCQSCGMERAQLAEGVSFVDKKCPGCLMDDIGVSAVADAAPGSESGVDVEADGATEETIRQTVAKPDTHSPKQKRRRNKRKHRTRPKEKKPWYAPLEPLLRPRKKKKKEEEVNIKVKAKTKKTVHARPGRLR
ncbi:hypothetical protein BD289DRAFT_25352 [Coniella lustricola]|uniref:Uncharacterized protein n=1 Tax=Coniella lustricola TaxID=2025994 RepID=A0A2T3A3C7_9PEZI|nr:hypothetical protein BD289DRAFT_25352 [Coniella lustricola]